MASKADLLNKKQEILNFIGENDNPTLLSKLKEVIDNFRFNQDDDELLIPDWHKKIVREQIKNSNSENYVSRKDFDKLIS